MSKKLKKQKISPKTLAFLVLEATNNDKFSIFFCSSPLNEQKKQRISSKEVERVGQQKVHLIKSAQIVAKNFAATQNKSEKISLINRLKNDFNDFVSCYDAPSRYLINTRIGVS